MGEICSLFFESDRYIHFVTLMFWSLLKNLTSSYLSINYSTEVMANSKGKIKFLHILTNYLCHPTTITYLSFIPFFLHSKQHLCPVAQFGAHSMWSSFPQLQRGLLYCTICPTCVWLIFPDWRRCFVVGH